MALNGALIWTFILALPLPGVLTVPADRTLYFKLPIEGVRLYWEFQDPAAFLGWNGAKPADEDDRGFCRTFMRERGVDGRLCGSHH